MAEDCGKLDRLRASAARLNAFGEDVVASYSLLSDYDLKQIAHDAAEIGRLVMEMPDDALEAG